MSLVRPFMTSMAIVGCGVLLLFLVRGWNGNQIGFMHVRVINDTKRTVTVQPCWDLFCNSIIGMRDATLGPGVSRQVAGVWSNDISHEIAVAILTPNAGPFHYNGCLYAYFDAGKIIAVFRVSLEGPCLTNS